MAESIRSILAQFRLRVISDRDVFEKLRQHGFPKVLDEQVIQILKKVYERNNNYYYSFRYAHTLEDIERELRNLLNGWQQSKKKERRKKMSLLSETNAKKRSLLKSLSIIRKVSRPNLF